MSSAFCRIMLAQLRWYRARRSTEREARHLAILQAIDAAEQQGRETNQEAA